jgi:hypothetical protein
MGSLTTRRWLKTACIRTTANTKTSLTFPYSPKRIGKPGLLTHMNYTLKRLKRHLRLKQLCEGLLPKNSTSPTCSSITSATTKVHRVPTRFQRHQAPFLLAHKLSRINRLLTTIDITECRPRLCQDRSLNLLMTLFIGPSDFQGCPASRTPPPTGTCLPT